MQLHNFSLEKGFFSVKDFCQWVSIGPTTFYNLVNDGQISTVKIGSKTLVSYPEALRFAALLCSVADDDEGNIEGKA